MNWQDRWPTTTDLAVCPYLGRAQDRDSVCGYPTDENACYAPLKRRWRPSRDLPLEKQRHHCLSHYGKCRIYYDALARASHGKSGTRLAGAVGDLSRRALRALSVIVGVF